MCHTSELLTEVSYKLIYLAKLKAGEMGIKSTFIEWSLSAQFYMEGGGKVFNEK